MLQYECDSPGDLEAVKNYSLKEFIYLSNKNKRKNAKAEQNS